MGGMGIGILWKGITLGLGAAAPIGPVNVEIARRAIRGGFWAGFLLGVECLRSVRKQWAEPQGEAGPPPRRNYLTGLVMTALNPMTLAFWFFAPKMTGVKEGREMPLLCAGVAAGTFVWVCFFASLMSAAGKKGKARAVALANLAGGLTLLGFGGRAIWQVVRPYL